MNDRDKLAAALKLYSDPKFVVIDLSPELRVLAAAARRQLLLEPVPCEHCDSGVIGFYSHTEPSTGEHLGNQDVPCPSCHGRGTVYPPASVSVVAGALMDHEGDTYEGEAVAVLDALNDWRPE